MEEKKKNNGFVFFIFLIFLAMFVLPKINGFKESTTNKFKELLSGGDTFRIISSQEIEELEDTIK